ncbi:MAG: hypothetical protein HLUCCO02_00885 [Idiomarinaceae bacterium HL-53]|nr:MAG: hypothetical protein HLUCCO02_00885 [Idiomarinaceae bacterium HL-53]CUS48589.1 hypothetical protein Ga0003345_1548 [Idiomarinaceae bacterium HL-53]
MINATDFSPFNVAPQRSAPNAPNVRKEQEAGADATRAPQTAKETQGQRFEAALVEREQLAYDAPGRQQQSAIGRYGEVANFARRDEIQQMVGVDIYI